MFEEFRLHPDAVREMTVLAAIRIVIILAIMPLILLIKYLEGDFAIMNVLPGAFGLWFAMIGIISVVRIIRARHYAKNFKLLCLGDQLKFNRGLTEVNLPFSSISKVVIQPDGSIMIYTGNRLPFLLISRHLERKELLLNILAPFVRIEQSNRKHLISNPVFRLSLYGLMMLTMVAFFASRSVMVVVPLGTLLFGYFTFQIYYLTRQRQYLNNPFAPILLALLSLFFLARMIFIMGGDHFLFHMR